ncbi:MAG: YbgC/FadM family acyl-CoA thioesterase [Rhodospirillaceae bacterium]|nr:MAG: YbgC/FadM family acyl-CoA thioesterase [Rhodospirillaceae bacterium]
MATSDLPLPASGVLRDGTHLLPIRVYYEDTDAGGIVYHATYLRFAERARTEMLRAIGVDLIRLRDDHGLVFVVRRGEVDYQRAARLDDMLMVQSDLVELGGATATIAQVIRRLTPAQDLGEELVTFRAHVACMQTSGRAGRLPPDVRARMKTLVKTSHSTTPSRSK